MHLRFTTSMLPVLMMAATLACSRNPTSPDDLQPTEPVTALIVALEQQGATVVRMEQMAPDSHCLSVGALRLVVNGENVYVFEYASADAANGDASGISPDGSTIATTGRACHIDWIGPPRFYKKDRLIVIYVGTNQDLIRMLDGLLGRPFAVR